MPPTIGAAMGFITSDPTPVSHRIGTRLVVRFNQFERIW